MPVYICPLCGKDSTCHREFTGSINYSFYDCGTYHVKFHLSEGLIGGSVDEEDREKLLNLVTEQLVHSPTLMKNGIGHYWHFFYQPGYQMKDSDLAYYINLADRINNYPNNILDIVNRGLLNLSYYSPKYEGIIEMEAEYSRLLFQSPKRFIHGIKDFYEELGYITKAKIGANTYVLTVKAWQKIDELRKNEQVLKQAFIAMQFGEKTMFIREAFRKAIRESGYSERFIDEKEHNNQIVPEILYEISRSRFMVVDITFPNYGAYYEAGYGQALGKEVIICCRKEEFDSLEKKPHFDIAQKSMIVWTDTDDLIARLKRRIEATVK